MGHTLWYNRMQYPRTGQRFPVRYQDRLALLPRLTADDPPGTTYYEYPIRARGRTFGAGARTAGGDRVIFASTGRLVTVISYSSNYHVESNFGHLGHQVVGASRHGGRVTFIEAQPAGTNPVFNHGLIRVTQSVRNIRNVFRWRGGGSGQSG